MSPPVERALRALGWTVEAIEAARRNVLAGVWSVRLLLRIARGMRP